MFNTHRTKDGQKIIVAQMNTTHLLNTISLHVRNLKEITSVQETTVNPRMAAMYGISLMDEADIGDAVRAKVCLLRDYVIEAAIRRRVMEPSHMAQYDADMTLLAEIVGRPDGSPVPGGPESGCFLTPPPEDDIPW